MTNEQIATDYIEAVGRHDLQAVDRLFGADLTARFAGQELSREQWIGGLNRLLPALVRNDIRHVSGSGDEVVVVYDFVTDTAAGAVPCAELVTIDGEQITHVELIFDQKAFAPVNEELARRSS